MRKLTNYKYCSETGLLVLKGFLELVSNFIEANKNFDFEFFINNSFKNC